MHAQCMYTHMYAIHIHMCTQCTHACISVHTHTRIHIYIHTNVQEGMYRVLEANILMLAPRLTVHPVTQGTE